MMSYCKGDYYNKKARQSGYNARSALKLKEIDAKFHFFHPNIQKVLDIGCSPGSWMQYVALKVKHDRLQILGVDINEVDLHVDGVKAYVQDVTDVGKMKEILVENNFIENGIDVIMSDLAPNTIGFADIDAIRSFAILEETLRIYKAYLKKKGKFVIKLFMGPGFDEFIRELKQHFGGKKIKLFKPQSSRDQSKEIYVVKI